MIYYFDLQISYKNKSYNFNAGGDIEGIGWL